MATDPQDEAAKLAEEWTRDFFHHNDNSLAEFLASRLRPLLEKLNALEEINRMNLGLEKRIACDWHFQDKGEPGEPCGTCLSCRDEQVASLTQRLAEAEAREKFFREALWLGHGHTTSLYGDDGEMSCGTLTGHGPAIHGPVDFKRDNAERCRDAFLGAIREQFQEATQRAERAEAERDALLLKPGTPGSTWQGEKAELRNWQIRAETAEAQVATLQREREEARQGRAIDGKFRIVGGEIVKTSSGEVLPHDEPLWLVRARDYLALPAIEYYTEMSRADGCTDFHIECLRTLSEAFRGFAVAHPDRVKQPGITRGAPFRGEKSERQRLAEELAEERAARQKAEEALRKVAPLSIKLAAEVRRAFRLDDSAAMRAFGTNVAAHLAADIGRIDLEAALSEEPGRGKAELPRGPLPQAECPHDGGMKPKDGRRRCMRCGADLGSWADPAPAEEGKP